MLLVDVGCSKLFLYDFVSIFCCIFDTSTICAQFLIIIIIFCFDRMTDLVDINFNYGGQWHYEGDELYYNNGDVDTVLNFDVDFLSYLDILARYREVLGYPNVSTIFVLEPGKKLKDGLFIVQDDAGIRKVLHLIRMNSWVYEIDIYAHHMVDIPVIAKEPLLIENINVDANSNEGVGNDHACNNDTLPT